MAVKDHPLFSEWSGAWDALENARQHYSAAKELGNARLVEAMKAKLDEAIANYEMVVGNLYD